MTERVPSDHETVDSHRVHLSSVGHTSRLQVLVPEECSCSPGDVVVISLAGTRSYCQLEETLDGQCTIRGAYPNRRLAREAGGENAFPDWLEATGLGDGDALLLDVLSEGFAYGLRQPGERVVYEPPDEPDSSLADIAESIGEE